MTGVIRALLERNHKVTVILSCKNKELVKDFSPEITEFVHMNDLVPDLNFFGDLRDFETFRIIFSINATELFFNEIDTFIQRSKSKFDIIFSDFCAPGTIPAARKHGLKVVAQYMGSVLPTYASAFYMDQLMIPVEDPDVRYEQTEFKLLYRYCQLSRDMLSQNNFTAF